MMWKEQKGQTAIEMALAVAGAIVVATLVGLFAKQLFAELQPEVTGATNTVVNQIA